MGSEKILWLERTSSTNEVAKQYLSSQQGFCVATGFQESGRGQAGNTWVSEEGKNLLASYVFSTRITIAESFAISMIASLAVVRFLNSYGFDAQIKWPNDIIVKEKKIAGILIENIIMGDVVENTIVGIGINLNQSEFAGLPNATSLSLIANTEFEPESMAIELQRFLKISFEEYNEPVLELKENYVRLLFRKEGAVYNHGSKTFTAKIADVAFDGRLTLIGEDEKTDGFYFKQIEMVF
jgi:BirA family biotin operon repressor/biotin-[acetyl-CoA-carboxylase] ligase